MPRHRAVAEAAQLREDEPHPMAGLAAGSKFPADLLDDGCLGSDEAGQIEGIAAHVLSPGCGSCARRGAYRAAGRSCIDWPCGGHGRWRAGRGQGAALPRPSVPRSSANGRNALLRGGDADGRHSRCPDRFRSPATGCTRNSSAYRGDGPSCERSVRTPGRSDRPSGHGYRTARPNGRSDLRILRRRRAPSRSHESLTSSQSIPEVIRACDERASEALALQTLALQLAGATNGFRRLTGALLRGLLVVTTKLHLAKHTLALHFLLEGL